MPEVKFGALCWNQYTDWPSLLQAGIRADEVGYTNLWTWDQLRSSPAFAGRAEQDRRHVLRPSALDGLAIHTEAAVEAPHL